MVKGGRLRYSLTGEVSCQCEDGLQRQESGGQCHQHSTQAWHLVFSGPVAAGKEVS